MNHPKDPPGTYTGAPQGPPHLQNIPGKDTSSTKRHTKEPRLITGKVIKITQYSPEKSELN